MGISLGGGLGPLRVSVPLSGGRKGGGRSKQAARNAAIRQQNAQAQRMANLQYRAAELLRGSQRARSAGVTANDVVNVWLNDTKGTGMPVSHLSKKWFDRFEPAIITAVQRRVVAEAAAAKAHAERQAAKIAGLEEKKAARVAARAAKKAAKAEKSAARTKPNLADRWNAANAALEAKVPVLGAPARAMVKAGMEAPTWMAEPAHVAYKPGDIANGHVLSKEGAWWPLGEDFDYSALDPATYKPGDTANVWLRIYKPGDVINDHVFTDENVWEPDAPVEAAAEPVGTVSYKPGDVINGHVLTSDNGWVPEVESTAVNYKPGDVVNGHVLTSEGVWKPLA